MIKITWLSLKDYIELNNSITIYVQVRNKYLISTTDLQFRIYCELPILEEATSDQQDFEQNYKTEVIP
jgi:hypothetical protein